MAINKRNGVEAAGVKLLLNKMNSTAAKVRLGSLLDGQKGSVRAKYDFATQGGAVSTINLLDEEGNAVKLPDNAIITDVIIDVITAPTSGGSATIAVGAVASNDLLGATAIASFTGILQGVPDDAVANMIKLSAEATLDMTIATAALTAGKFIVFVDYVVSE
jgi:hypothetical protein